MTTPVSTTWTIKFDIFGNVAQRQLACCNEQTTTLTDTNGYAMPEQGDQGGERGPPTDFERDLRFQYLDYQDDH